MMANFDVARYACQRTGFEPRRVRFSVGATELICIICTRCCAGDAIHVFNLTAFLLSVGLSELALFGVEAAISIFTGRHLAL